MAAVKSDNNVSLEIFVEKRMKQLEKDRQEIPNLFYQQYMNESKLKTMTQRHQYRDRLQLEKDNQKIKARIEILESPDYIRNFHKTAIPYLVVAEQERIAASMQRYVQAHVCNPEPMTICPHVVVETIGASVLLGLGGDAHSTTPTPHVSSTSDFIITEPIPSVNIPGFSDKIRVAAMDTTTVTTTGTTTSTIVKPEEDEEQMDLFEVKIVLNLDWVRVPQMDVFVTPQFVTVKTESNATTMSSVSGSATISTSAADTGPVKKKRGRKRLCDKQVFVGADPKKPRFNLSRFFDNSKIKVESQAPIVKSEPVVKRGQSSIEIELGENDMGTRSHLPATTSSTIATTTISPQDRVEKPLVTVSIVPIFQVKKECRIDGSESLLVNRSNSEAGLIKVTSGDDPTLRTLRCAGLTVGLGKLHTTMDKVDKVDKVDKANKNKKRKVDSLAFEHFLMDVEHHPNKVQIVGDDLCINSKCVRRPMVRMTETSLLMCEGCGYSKVYLDATSTSGSIGNATQNTKYNEGTHMTEFLITYENLESYVVPDDTMKKIMEHLFQRGYQKRDDITCVAIRETMKDLSLSKIYGNMTQIYCRITGRAPPRLTPGQRDLTKKMFEMIQKVWPKYRPITRQNAMHYAYQFYKICQSCGWDHFLEYIVLMTGDDKLDKHEDWMRNCYNDLLASAGDPRWVFIPVQAKTARPSKKHLALLTPSIRKIIVQSLDNIQRKAWEDYGT